MVVAGAVAVWCPAPLAVTAAPAARAAALAGTWGTVIEVPGLGALNQGGAAQLNQVSCGAAGNCVAVGSYADGSFHAQAFLVSERHGVLNGFVCGFADPAEFYRSMWRNRLIFALPAVGALLRHPSLGANMVNAVRRIQTTATQGPPLACELSSIAVAPEAAGKGLGKSLLRAFLARSWAQRAQCVYLTTDAEGNEGANELYREVGFQHSRRFLQQKGRWMNEYVFHRVPASQPVETLP